MEMIVRRKPLIHSISRVMRQEKSRRIMQGNSKRGKIRHRAEKQQTGDERG